VAAIVSNKFAVSAWVSLHQRWALLQWRKYLLRCVRYRAGARAHRAAAANSLAVAGGSNTRYCEKASVAVSGGGNSLFGTPFTSDVRNNNNSFIREDGSSFMHLIPPGISMVLPGEPVPLAMRRRESPLYFTFIQQKAARTSLLSWCMRAAVLRRVSLCNRAAVAFYLTRRLCLNLRRWRRLVRIDVRRRERQRKKMLRVVMAAWVASTVLAQRHRAQLSAVDVISQRAKLSIMDERFHAWQMHLRQRKRLERAARRCRDRCVFSVKQRLFTTWRCLWSSNMYWRYREAILEQQKLRQLQSLQLLEVTELEKERNKQREATIALEESLVALREELEERDSLLLEQQNLIMAKTAEKLEVELALKKVNRDIADAMQDRERLRAFEERIQLEREQLDLEVTRRRAEAAAVIAKLQVMMVVGTFLSVPLEAVAARFLAL
jgi:hypothetical protein